MENFFKYKNKSLHIDGVEIPRIIRHTGTPVYIYSARRIISRIESYKKGLKGYSHIICYALKANSNNAIVRLVSKSGCGADITSGGELYRALKGGVDPSKIVYAGVGKTAEEMRYALKSGILMFNLESWPEAVLLNSVAGSAGKKARVAVRINPDVDARTHKKITTGRSGTKFGIPISEAVEFYRRLAGLKNLEISGIHSHIGSQITSSAPFVESARKIKDLIPQIEKFALIKYVDLGGGLGITYRPTDNPPAPERFAKDVLKVFSSHEDKKRTYIFEPGRSIVGDSSCLVSSVIYVKKVLGKNFVILDAGMSDLIRPALYDAYHEILPVGLYSSSGRFMKADVVGPICETGDFLGLARKLPAEINSGDLIAVMSAGAYGYAMSSQYNSRPRPAEVMVYPDGKFRVIRRREDYQDLVRTEKI